MEKLTQHATARMQQRGIREETIECLVRFGSKTHDHQGGVILYFDKQARKRLQDEFDQQLIRRMETQLDAYVVISEHGEVVTVGHRSKRINRH